MMPITHGDVTHIAALARLGVDPARLDELAGELNGILAHMEVLSEVDTSVTSTRVTPPVCTALRSDSSGPVPLEIPRESFAPSVRDGFFLVPRLASHEAGEVDDASR